MRQKYLSISKLPIVALSVAAALVSLNVRWKQNFFMRLMMNLDNERVLYEFFIG